MKFLDDSSTSPSPNKLHKTRWGKMRDILQTRKESVRKKSSRGSKSSPDVVPVRRRSLSDGVDSDANPVLTLTIPSSEELESEPSHPVLRKQRSLELGARPPQHRPPRASKWTKVKRAFLTSASASVPSSPNRHSAFFTDAVVYKRFIFVYRACADRLVWCSVPTRAACRAAPARASS
ncbi:uncharacterized protein [Choristoneura fumiferana]|uniref:uncharacterized protein n=1 Tax=Choristoneura fumiferana TaxID=7141 RepID=UPI003D15BA4D